MGTTQYKLTPGDIFELAVAIEDTQRYPLTLDESFKLDVPFIGTLNVKGMYFLDLKNLIVSRIRAKVPVQFVDFVLKSPALFDVFVHGGVTNPGIATVNSLARVSEAIALAKGFVKGASFRRIELYRGKERWVIDLSRFIAQADFTQNPLLEPGDRIFIPAAERIVQLEGEVMYPGVYELLEGETLEDLIDFAGGPLPNAKSGEIRIRRITENNLPALLTVGLSSSRDAALRNGDSIAIASAFRNPEMITVDGALFGTPVAGDKPAQIPTNRIVANLPCVEGMTVLDVLDSLGGPTPLADAGKSFLKRRDTGEKIPFDAQLLWDSRSPEQNLVLKSGDLLVVPMKKLQVVVSGEVNNPGAIPYLNGLKVSDYLLGAGGIKIETGDRNSVFFIDEIGNRTRTNLNAEVEPGQLIYVAPNSWTMTQKTLQNVLIITGFVGAMVILANSIVDLIQEF
jgi:protein involved in polysaccharide export with SLBB domain